MKMATFVWLLLSICGYSFAMDEGVMEVSMRPMDNKTDSINFRSFIDGWTCYATNSFLFTEYQTDDSGKTQYFPRKSESKLPFSLIVKPEIKNEFRKDMSIKGKVSATIGETCSRKSTKMIPRETCFKDITGKQTCQTVEVLDQKEETFMLIWNCSFSQFPNREGEKMTSTCESAHSFSHPEIQSNKYVSLASERIFVGELVLKKRESFDQNLCENENLALRMITKLTQALKAYL